MRAIKQRTQYCPGNSTFRTICFADEFSAPVLAEGSARLDPAQEKELDEWMISLEAANTPATPGMVEGEANRTWAVDGSTLKGYRTLECL